MHCKEKKTLLQCTEIQTVWTLEYTFFFCFDIWLRESLCRGRSAGINQKEKSQAWCQPFTCRRVTAVDIPLFVINRFPAERRIYRFSIRLPKQQEKSIRTPSWAALVCGTHLLVWSWFCCLKVSFCVMWWRSFFAATPLSLPFNF